MIKPTWFIGLIATLVAVTAIAEVPNAPEQVQPLSVGSRAPAFAAHTVDGKIRIFKPDGYQKPTIVIFYRGGWCPYWADFKKGAITYVKAPRPLIPLIEPGAGA